MKKILLLLLFVCMMFLSYYAFAGDLSTDFYNKVFKEANDIETKTKKNIINNYCNWTLSLPWYDNDMNLTWDDVAVFLSQKSLFVYYLCYNVNKSYEDKFTSNFEEWLLNQFTINCNNDTYLPNWNDCHIAKDSSKSIHDLFNTIMNDYFDIFLARIYTQNPVMISNKYFNLLWADTQCAEKKEDNCYIWPTNSWQHNYRSHPKTKKILEDYNKKWKKLLNKIKLLNKDRIEDNTYFAEAFEWVSNDKNYNMDTQLVSFQKVVINELMRYSLFINYYNNYISSPQLQPISLDYIKWYNTQEISDSVNALKYAEKTIFRTMSSLKNIYLSFPIHIWMIAYQEDIWNLMKSLKKIYTPLHQMYYKYQKVQEKN